MEQHKQVSSFVASYTPHGLWLHSSFDQMLYLHTAGVLAQLVVITSNVCCREAC